MQGLLGQSTFVMGDAASDQTGTAAWAIHVLQAAERTRTRSFLTMSQGMLSPQGYRWAVEAALAAEDKAFEALRLAGYLRSGK